MRKFLVLFSVLFAVAVNAQHMSFTGIPLDGSISSFSAKIKAKGFVISKYTKQLPAGVRMFNGIFIGRKSDVYVYYNTKTEFVYRAKACIRDEDIDRIKSLLGEVKDMLSEKYINISNDGTQDGYPGVSMQIFNSDNMDGTATGYIDLYISKENIYPLPESYCLHIDYIDALNYKKNQSSKIEDL